jgi:AmmeMemoRadiSam system protein A
VVGDAAPEAVAAALAPFHADPETLIVVSTDLSHFLARDAAQAADARTARRIETWSLGGDAAALGPRDACGWRPLAAALALAAQAGDRVLRLDMRDSTAGGADPDRVVGYGAWRIEPAEGAALPPALAAQLPGLARAALASRLKNGKPPRVALDTFPPPLRTWMASFVTLTIGGRLRGCIGSLAARRPLAEDVAMNAVAAGVGDRRFRPMTAAELARAEIHVSLLSPAGKLAFGSEAELLARLRPGRDGLILSDAGRSGVFLPAVWESLPTPEAFLRGLKAKAGLAREHWSDTLTARRFTVEAVSAPPPAEAGRPAEAVA